MTSGSTGSALFTDLYELTMASAYFAEGADDDATFELWVRELPPNRNFLVVAGLQQVVDHLSTLSFKAEDLAYLASLAMFPDAFLEHLRDLRFTGDLWAMPEGTIAFAGEPLLRVRARRIEAQLVETFLLTATTFETMIATKAARVAIAAGGRPFADFSARRDHGAGAAMRVARAAYIGGAASTSNVAAGRDYGIPVSGTMAHSFVLSFPDELTAFRAYARAFPSGGTLLIDTYDTRTGTRNALTVARELRESGGSLGAVRIDSGDLATEARSVRGLLDDGGFAGVRIVASGDLDEYAIADLLGGGAPIDAFGVGTRLGTSADAPYLSGVYKLVEDASGGKAKTSAGKVTIPFAKQVYRTFNSDGVAVRDTIARDTEADVVGEPLLVPVIRGGAAVRAPESLNAARERCAASVGALAAHLHQIRTAEVGYPVGWSAEMATWANATQAKPRLLEGERPRDRYGRPLPWGSPSELELLDYDSLPMLASHSMAIDYFNEQAFFQAHEAWEAAWRKSQRDTDEAFFNGLAKLGAGFTHIQRENAHGAFTLITKATERIEPYGPAHQGMDVAALCKDLRAVAATLAPAARKKAKPPATAFPVIARSP